MVKVARADASYSHPHGIAVLVWATSGGDLHSLIVKCEGCAEVEKMARASTTSDPFQRVVLLPSSIVKKNVHEQSPMFSAERSSLQSRSSYVPHLPSQSTHLDLRRDYQPY